MPADRSAAQGRELRLRTIKGLRELLREGTTMSPAADGLSVESNGYGLWLVAYDPQPISTAPISDEEILRRIEAREALRDAK